jgi:hypothetical protein
MTVFRLRHTGLHWREIGDETVVVDVPASLYLSANASGTLLWNELAEGATKARLADRLVHAFGIDRGRAERDVDVFLAALSERGLVEALPEPA